MFEEEKINSLLAERKPFHPLPGDFYRSCEFCRADLERIFHREWIFAGHTFELDKLGSYLTLQVGWYPIVVVRGKDGQIRAMHNVCRHRGAKICSETHGRASRLVCSYHQRGYGLDGSLQLARVMCDDLDKQGLGLKPVHCETVNSYIFVCLAEQPRDFDMFRRGAEPHLAPHDLENAKVAHDTTIPERGNWKFVFENNSECYHCDVSHPQLMRSFVENRTVAGIDAADSDSNVTVDWARCEKTGFRRRMNLDPSGQFRPTRLPVAEGTFSYTISGMSAVRGSLGQADRQDFGVLPMLNHPSACTPIPADHAISFRVLPVGPHDTLLTTQWVVNKEAKEGADHDMDHLVDIWSQTNEEDRQLVERAAEGVSSPASERGPFSLEAEAGQYQFVDWYCRFMQACTESTVLR